MTLPRKPLAIRRSKGPATLMLRQWLAVLTGPERRHRRFARVLAQVPRTDPGQTIIGAMGLVSQRDQAHRGALRHDGGVEVQQQIIRTGLSSPRMRQLLTKTRSRVDFQQPIGQVDLRKAATELFCEGLHTLGAILTCIHRHDPFPLLDPEPIAWVQQTVDTREQVCHCWRAIAQARGTRRVEGEWRTAVLSEMRP